MTNNSLVQQPIKKTAYIVYNDIIDEPRIQWFMTQLGGLFSSNNYDKFVILISSNGGDPAAGLTAYNFLRSLPLKVVTHSIGYVHSAAVILFLAGEERYSCEGSTFLIHSIAFNLPNGGQITPINSGDIDSVIKVNNETARKIYKERTTLTAQKITGLLKSNILQDTKFAKDYSLINEVKPIEIKDGDLFVVNYIAQAPK